MTDETTEDAAIEDTWPLNGPYSPHLTATAAAAAAELIRYLNHATQSSNSVRIPADVYQVIGHLNAALWLLPQALQQLSHRLTVLAARPGAYATPPERAHDLADADEVAADVAYALTEVGAMVGGLLGTLGHAHSQASRIGINDDGDTGAAPRD